MLPKISSGVTFAFHVEVTSLTFFLRVKEFLVSVSCGDRSAPQNLAVLGPMNI